MSRDIRKESLEQKRRVEISDPCHIESKHSYKCLNDNNYDYEKCEKQFDNVKQCKKFWSQIVDLRKQFDIEPNFPQTEERNAIKQEYVKVKSFRSVVKFMKLYNEKKS